MSVLSVSVARTRVGVLRLALVRRPLVRVAVGLLVLFALLAIIGPAIAPQNPNTVNIAAAFAGPSWSHPLGTDALGRDLLSRLIVGARSSLLGPLVIVVLSATAGTVLGVFAAWAGGGWDALLSRMMDILFAFPGLLLALLAVALFGPGLEAPIVALSISYVPYVFRLVRGPALRERALPYVQVSYLQGVSALAIMGRHVLPNIRRQVLVQASLSFGYATVDLAALSFLGLGVQPPQANWGAMISTGEPSVLRGYPEEAIFASVCIVLTVTAVNVIGAWLSDVGERES